MKTSTLKDKVLEVYIKNDNPDKRSLKRGIERYMRKPCSDRKLERILNDLNERYDLQKEAAHIKSKNNLSDYIDSIIIGRIRDAYKNRREFAIDELEELEFKSLVRRVIIHFGYEPLYRPITDFDNVDLIVHRENVKIAIFAIKTGKDCKVGIKSVRQARYITNYYHCDKAIIFSSTSFDDDAIEEAEDVGVTLIGIDKLLPMVKDLIYELKTQEKEILISDLNDENYRIFLDCIIKSPKTKVQIVDIKYFTKKDDDQDIIVFEGRLLNTGKRPVEDLIINIRIFDRTGLCQYDKSLKIGEQRVESKEKCNFNMTFDEIPRNEWRNLCRYEVKLEYKNIYARR